MLLKHVRKQDEWKQQVGQLTAYENCFIRRAHIQLALDGTKKVQLDSHLLGLLYKMNRCRRGLRMKEVGVDGVDAFLPNRPVPKSVLEALQSPEVPGWLKRRLSVSPRTRRESRGFWDYEKREVREWKKGR
jgi:hypothetical protein